MIKSKNKQKVFVGMSGGVDSSVSAALLKEKGYDVTGVFIKVWQPDFIECTWKEDRLDAMRVASVLDIPFITLDLEKEYKQGVIDYMIKEYQNGRTPNPDVMCNREVKFGAFLKWALENGADYVATGHYAQIKNNVLEKSKDTEKDQTYFLWTLTSEQLKNIIFPVGHLEKKEVRLLAEKYNLPNKSKKDSQGLCFVGTIDVKTLLKNYIKEKRGDVVNKDGEVIGHHEGINFYTIGERHGFVITKKKTDDIPYYVVSKDVEKNTLTVSNVPHKETHGNDIKLESSMFNKDIKNGETYEARSRYRAPLCKVKVLDKNIFSIIEGDVVATSGQSLVLYDGEYCIGGGIIK